MRRTTDVAFDAKFQGKVLQIEIVIEVHSSVHYIRQHCLYRPLQLYMVYIDRNPHNFPIPRT